MTALLWYRRDLRLRDLPALHQAASTGPVAAVFVLDPHLWAPAGVARRAHLVASLSALAGQLRSRGGRLIVRSGDPVEVIATLTREFDADSVHVTADSNPYGAARDDQVATALESAGRRLVRTGTPYAVAPGTVRKPDRTAYKVFTPFYRAWLDTLEQEENLYADAAEIPDVEWRSGASEDLPVVDVPDGLRLPQAGEEAAVQRAAEFADRVDDYAEKRDLPGVAGTSRLSVHLRWGEIHPRRLIRDLPRRGSNAGRDTWLKELGWREFYADVLHHNPASARHSLNPKFANIAVDTSQELFRAWCAGRTGFPIVDAGMRELLGSGWMHNRVRMITASFLVKDLHLPWQWGARHFMRHLVDGDLASNQHGWQWVAGSGTDAAPYFRVFNPTTQGRKFDPDGDYIRRWVPELADAADPHEPGAAAYPAPVVEHAEERREALRRYDEIR